MDEPEDKQPAPQNAEPQPVPQLNSLNSFKSLDSMNQDQPEKPPEDDGQQLQVVQTKADKGINREEIMRMFTQQLQKEEKERQQIEKRRMEMRLKAKNAAKPAPKRPAIEEKKIAKDQALQQALSQKSARIRKMIQPHCKKYRAMFRPSIYDNKMNKYRFQCKEKLFLNLCYGIEELRSFAHQQLSEVERDILTQDPYAIVKRIATQIDAALIKILNKGDRNEISREYKSQWQTLLTNIKDEGNLELKRKILTRTMEPSKIAFANEIDFFTLAKREEIIEKQKRYVAQFTVQKAIVKPLEEQYQELHDKPRVEEELPQAGPTLKPQRTSLANKYIDQSSILSIQEFLSEGQLTKMLKRLQEDIQGKSQALLIRNFKEVFKL